MRPARKPAGCVAPPAVLALTRQWGYLQGTTWAPEEPAQIARRLCTDLSMARVWAKLETTPIAEELQALGMPREVAVASFVRDIIQDGRLVLYSWRGVCRGAPNPGRLQRVARLARELRRELQGAESELQAMIDRDPWPYTKPRLRDLDAGLWLLQRLAPAVPPFDRSQAPWPTSNPEAAPRIKQRKLCTGTAPALWLAEQIAGGVELAREDVATIVNAVFGREVLTKEHLDNAANR